MTAQTSRDLWLWQLTHASDESNAELLGLFQGSLVEYRALADEGVAHDDFGNDLTDAIANVESHIADIEAEQAKRKEGPPVVHYWDGHPSGLVPCGAVAFDEDGRPVGLQSRQPHLVTCSGCSRFLTPDESGDEPTTQGERDKITARLQDVTADPADELTQVSEEMGLYPDREQS